MHKETEPYLNFDPPLAAPGDPLEEAALKFHQENPHVLRELASVALQVRRAGWTRWSIKGAFEVIRYNGQVKTTGRTYKLNNNHSAYYARWIMRDVPELQGFFRTREAGRVPQEYDE
jgi:hypothetical protein